MATAVEAAGSGRSGDGRRVRRAGRRGHGGAEATLHGLTRRRVGRAAAGLAGGGGLAALLTDCGRGQADEGPPPARSKEPVTVEYWTTWAQERVDLMAPQVPTFEQRTGL